MSKPATIHPSFDIIMIVVKPELIKEFIVYADVSECHLIDMLSYFVKTVYVLDDKLDVAIDFVDQFVEQLALNKVVKTLGAYILKIGMHEIMIDENLLNLIFVRREYRMRPVM